MDQWSFPLWILAGHDNLPIPPGERCKADDGYVGESPHSIKCPCAVMAHPQERDRMRAIVWHRHETANERLKIFSILSDLICHDLTQRGCVFRACASLIQLSIEHGDPLFHANYNPNVGMKQVFIVIFGLLLLLKQYHVKITLGITFFPQPHYRKFYDIEGC